METKSEDVLIYDIETQVFGRPNPEQDKFQLFCCYSYKSRKYYCTKDVDTVKMLIDKHKFLVGFNNDHYDNPILVREGISFKYKIIIDLMKIIKSRKGGMMTKKGMLGNVLMRHSLDYITRFLDLVDDDSAKGDIDYSVFKKEKWTQDEEAEIKIYAKRDVEVTKKLYEWIEDYFSGFKEFIRPEDVDKKIYLTASIAKFAYKAICKAMGWEETYAGDVVQESAISGGYVAYPAGEQFEGDIYCIDYNSLYPHIMIQCNLFGRKKDDSDRPIWTGANKWKVEGTYYSDKLSPVAELLKNWYADRLKFKSEKDRREYTLKILLNTVYGLSDNPHYNLVYDKIAAGDCTRIGRQWTKYARKVFRDAGYRIIYTDTDSLYILDPFKDKEKMLSVKDKLIADIKATVPFPQETFDAGIDDEISHMFFFKGGDNTIKEDEELDEDDFINRSKNLLKKNYIYVTKDKEVKIKNLGIRKKSTSKLTRTIFWEYIVPRIVKEGKVKFAKTFIKNLITELLQTDISLASLRKEVGPFSQYEKTSPTSLPAQISKVYGSGIHFLIPNTRMVGVGKSKTKSKIRTRYDKL